MSDDIDPRLVWDSLVSHISEHTGIASADIEKVLDAECAYWNERKPLRQAVLNSYDPETDGEPPEYY